MKRTSVWIGVLALAFGCQVESALSESDPMDPGAKDGGSVTACTECFDQACAWEALECASDPGCAAWLTCAKECAEPDTCFAQCPAPGTSTGNTLRDVLSRCVRDTGCCDNNSEYKEAGPTSTDGGDAGAGGSGGMSDGGAGGGAMYACPEESCESCLAAIKGNSCAGDRPECANAIADCVHENATNGQQHCWSYLTARATCGGQDQPAATCSYEVPEPSLGLTVEALACAAAYCSACFPDSSGDCVTCQLASCPDEMTALMTTADAQELLWCRYQCRASNDPVACNQTCFAQHETGSTIVVDLYACTQSACKALCATQ
jgi:hypothetical protein